MPDTTRACTHISACTRTSSCSGASAAAIDSAQPPCWRNWGSRVAAILPPVSSRLHGPDSHSRRQEAESFCGRRRDPAARPDCYPGPLPRRRSTKAALPRAGGALTEANFVTKTMWLAVKDLRIEMRARDTLAPMLGFAATVALVLAFALPDSSAGQSVVAYVQAGFMAVAARGWFGILVAFDVIFVTAGALLFDPALD